MTLVRALYWNELATREVRPLLFQQAAALAKTAAVHQLVRPMSWTRLDEVCELIESVVTSR
jgi:hypothetical protein